jgi:hypothetical protein
MERKGNDPEVGGDVVRPVPEHAGVILELGIGLIRLQVAEVDLLGRAGPAVSSVYSRWSLRPSFSASSRP